jgi:flagellar biosynthesis chaperone FliJ
MNAFKKKDEDLPDVSGMLANGMSQQDIIDSLRQQGYDSTTIKDALVNALRNQAPQTSTAPQAAEPVRQEQPIQRAQPLQQPVMQERPANQFSNAQNSSGQNIDNIQQILEQIIDEKWKSSASELNSLRSGMNINSTSIENIKDQIDKLNQRIDSIQNTMVGKTEEYNKTISDVNVELQAFEKVIDRLVPAISDSIKELRDLIEGLKPQKGLNA